MNIPRNAYVYLTGGGPYDGYLWDLSQARSQHDSDGVLINFRGEDQIGVVPNGQVVGPDGRPTPQESYYKYVGADSDTPDGRARLIYTFQYPALT